MSTLPAVASVAIRACEAGDVAAITTIYTHHVRYGLASFELEPPSENDMRQRRLDVVTRGFPYLVAECEASGLRRIVAVIVDSANWASIGLHKSLGFARLGFSVPSGSNLAAGSTAW